MTTIKIGVIGYGSRGGQMAQLLCSKDPAVRITAIADPHHETIRTQAAPEDNLAETRFYADAGEMLEREPLDGVMIGTRCGAHARMAIQVLERGIPLFLEKPVATSLADLAALRAASKSRVVVSFPLRLTALVRLAREVIESGRIGTVEHVQAWNNVPYGWVYYQTWYRDEAETQGLFLQKATHDLDYINYLLGGLMPRRISAMSSKRVFHGTHRAGLYCRECPERTFCHESPYDQKRAKPLPLVQDSDRQCAFAVDTGNEDSGSALVEYESGMHVAYSQNFYARNGAAKRGATLIGYEGTIEFDWTTHTLKVFHHHSPQVETHTFSAAGEHGGGDDALMLNFLQVIRGEAPSAVPLEAGLLSAIMCLKARESAITHRVLEIEPLPLARRS